MHYNGGQVDQAKGNEKAIIYGILNHTQKLITDYIKRNDAVDSILPGQKDINNRKRNAHH